MRWNRYVVEANAPIESAVRHGGSMKQFSHSGPVGDIERSLPIKDTAAAYIELSAADV